MLMKLKDLLFVLGSCTMITIGTEDGQRWIFYGRTMQFVECYMYDKLMERYVVNVYMNDGRKDGNNCIDLEPNISIIVTGCENGTI